MKPTGATLGFRYVEYTWSKGGRVLLVSVSKLLHSSTDKLLCDSALEVLFSCIVD